MTGIEAEVIEGFKALPRRGAEIGGALLGHQNAAGEFLIDAWNPVPIEHRAGPSYVLSETDLERWRSFASSARASRQDFIGIYRSQTRPGLGVTPEDCAIVEKFLPRRQGVLLIVKPLSVSESVATFYLCDGGAVVEGESREFAFGKQVVPPGAIRATAEPSHELVSNAGTSAGDAVQRPALSERSSFGRPASRGFRSAHSRWRSAILPLSAMLAGSAAGFYVHSRGGIVVENPVPMSFDQDSREYGLKLRAERTADGIAIAWNANSPALSSASHADLLIENSRSRSDVPLGEAQLRSGVYHWRGSSGNTRFQMRVVTPAGREYLESVRVISPPGSQTSP